MQYDFSPKPEAAPFSAQVGKVLAIVIFRQATGETLGNSKWFIERNLGEVPYVDAHALGNLIKAYYESFAES